MEGRPNKTTEGLATFQLFEEIDTGRKNDHAESDAAQSKGGCTDCQGDVQNFGNVTNEISHEKNPCSL